MSPDGSVVVAGDRPNFGEPGSVRGWNAATGALAWQVDLPNENGGYQVALHAATLLGRQPDRVLRHRHPGGGDEYSYPLRRGDGSGPPPPPPPAKCVVPGVVGMQLDTARARIRDAGCSVGPITRVRSKQAGRVVAQSPAAGTRLPLGGRVDLTVGRR